MNSSTERNLGRGQALQRVTAQTVSSFKVNEMRMADYTNEKIVEFLETVSRRNEEGPSTQNLSTENLKLPETEGSEELTISSINEWKKSKQVLSTEISVNHEDGTPQNTVPAQFSFKEEDFPPL